eukprot:jgi/Chlat1/5409/Chrsp35S05311
MAAAVAERVEQVVVHDVAEQAVEQGAEEEVVVPAAGGGGVAILETLSPELFSQGAEARLFKVLFLDRPTIAKQRFSKQYRHPVLDAKLTLRRLNAEARGLLKARKLGVLTPAVYFLDHEESCLYLQEIEGTPVRDVLLKEGDLTEAVQQDIAGKVGRTVATLHDGGLIHGDLTTSNVLLRNGDGALVLIDFGLSYNSTLAEDKAVDLYFDGILAAYKKSSKNWSSVFNKFAEVRLRGRKRLMVG